MKNRAVRICAIVMAVFLLIGTGFYFVAGDSLHFTVNSSDAVSTKDHVGELVQDRTVIQPFQSEFDTIESVTLTLGTLKQTTDDIIWVAITDLEGNPLTDDSNENPLINSEGNLLTAGKIETKHLNAPETEFVQQVSVSLSTPVENAQGKAYLIMISSEKGVPGNAVTLYYGNGINTIRGSAPIEISEPNALTVDGELQLDAEGSLTRLCATVSGKNIHWFGEYYWFFFAAISLLVALLLIRIVYCYNKEKKNLILDIVLSIHKYWFLIRQLVARDFKTKYKRSVLGVLWSFLNPLLTMSIQYVIFSTLFGNDIAHFPIYLLSGIVCYNFFSEAANMCLMSIVGNATLINKVHVPKYIYPFSRTLSSCINLGLAMIPLIIMMIVEQTPITTALLLLPFVFLMLFILSYGVGLILATLMVFFRDTQFLWGIVSMLLMYLTPIFYSESIIPSWFLPIYKLNPLYHVLRFIRSILIDGVSLEPKAYLWCIVLCAVPLLLGILIFRKNQNKFIFNI